MCIISFNYVTNISNIMPIVHSTHYILNSYKRGDNTSLISIEFSILLLLFLSIINYKIT